MEREPEARLTVDGGIGESKEGIVLNQTPPSEQAGQSPPFSPDLSKYTQAFTAAVNLTALVKQRGGNRSCINLEVDCSLSICCL